MKRSKFKIMLLLIIIIVSICIYTNLNYRFFLNNIEDRLINIDKYYIYGTHLNIEGSLNQKLNNIEKISLLLKSKTDEIEYKVNYTNEDIFSFNTSNLLNEGINLEKLKNDKYYLLLKITYNNGVKYYAFKDKVNYNNTYYSISNNNRTNKIIIDSDKYMYISSKNIKKPDKVYDIIIDAGHGGNDPGASYNNYNEADLTLEYAKSLKKKLSNLGYKVKLTREDNTTLTTYGKNSRTSIPYEVKAKYLFSIHFNSSEPYISNNGFEIYVPSKINLSLATTLANNIVKNTGFNYSTNNGFKIKDGIYLRTLSEVDINNMKNEAKQNNYKMYNVNTSTPYLYMLRETGGFMTGAYNDGRNTKYNKNEYFNSNIAAESYLLELGYINDKNDIKFIINSKEKYTSSISKTIDEYIKNK